MALKGNTNEEKIWNYLISNGLNSYGAAGLMGNLFAESALRPDNLEDLCERRLAENGKKYTDSSYTAAIDNGKISRAEFLNPLPGKQYGYGLAQWTSPVRKAGLYDLVKSKKTSIADIEAQLEWLLIELKTSYQSVYNTLKSASSVKQASDSVLVNFECPADTGTAMKNTRASYGQRYYDKYAKTTVLGGEAKIMGNYDKYINSTGTHYISNSGHDENYGYNSGNAGDQTGNEWEIRSWYSRPWDCVLRYEKNPQVGIKLAELGCAAALNNKIGYDQYERDTYWNQLKANKYDPSKISISCESDCSAGVIANTRAVGYLLGISALQTINATYTGNMRQGYKNAGFTVLTDSKYTNSTEYLLPGDILLNDVNHVATNITKGSKAVASTMSTPIKKNTKYVGTGIGKAVSNCEMNIRDKASSAGNIIGVIPEGTTVEVLKIEGDWFKIVWPGASSGYAYTSNEDKDFYTYTKNKTTTTIKEEKNKIAKGIATKFKESLTGTYKVISEDLNIRTNYNMNADILGVIPKGTKVDNFGYYSIDKDKKVWLYIFVSYKGTNYTGFVCKEFLKKMK